MCIRDSIYTSLIDRTLFVLSRAVVVAIPAGVITDVYKRQVLLPPLAQSGLLLKLLLM